MNQKPVQQAPDNLPWPEAQKKKATTEAAFEHCKKNDAIPVSPVSEFLEFVFAPLSGAHRGKIPGFFHTVKS